MKRAFLLAISLLLLCYNVSVHAQQPTAQTALGVQPAIMEMVLDEEKDTQREITVLNLSDSAIPLKAVKAGFTVDEANSIPAEKLASYDASSWITISRDDTDFILQPRATKTIKLTIKQPKQASPGGHYATIYFQPLIPAQFISQESSFVYARVGVLLLMQVRGELQEQMKINNFTLDSNFSESSQLTSHLKLENIGNTHVVASGVYNIYDNFSGKLIGTSPIENSLTLPGLSKNIEDSVDLHTTLGFISVQAAIKYGTAQSPITSEKFTVLVLPYKSVLAVIAFIAFAIYVRKRRRRVVQNIVYTTNPTTIAPITVQPQLQPQTQSQPQIQPGQQTQL